MRNPQRIVSHDEALEQVWPDVHVSAGMVKEYVHDLRQILDDDPARPRFIETVRGRGYRFLGGIAELATSPPARAEAGPRHGPPTIAVLPFGNLSGEDRWSLFCRGLCNDLITDLSRFPDLVVTAKSAVLAYEQKTADPARIGRDLGVAYLLEGSVQAQDERVRINVQLTDTATRRHIWAECYERELVDLFTVQGDIVDQVAGAVGGIEGRITRFERVKLGRKPPESLEAYELYLRGYELVETFEKDKTLEALELLEAAVREDPHNARAWISLAWACHHTVFYGWAGPAERYRETARRAVVSAAGLDPRDPVVLHDLGALLAAEGRQIEAVEVFERALDFARNQADALALLSKHVAFVMDDPARALATCERCFALNPFPTPFYFMALLRAAFSMQSMAALRISTLCANVCFIGYGLLSDLYPVLALHGLLLPCNLLRLRQLGAGRPARRARRGQAAGPPVAHCASEALPAMRREPSPPRLPVATPSRRAGRDWLIVAEAHDADRLRPAR